MTHKLAARKGTRSSKSQVDTGAQSSTALHTVVSVGSPASFGGASLVALMVQLSVPSPLPTSDLAYEESLKEEEEALAETSLLQLSPVPSLTLTSLKLESLVARLCSSLCFLISMLVASIVKSDRFQLWGFQLTQDQLCRPQSSVESLHQKELAAAYATDLSFQLHSLQQKELAAAYVFVAQFQGSPTRARQLQLSTAQLCRQQSTEESLQQKELAAASCLMAQFPECPTRASQLSTAQLCFVKSPWQKAATAFQAIRVTAFRSAASGTAGFAAEASSTAAAALASASCTASRLRASPTMTTATTTTTTTPSFSKQWAQSISTTSNSLCFNSLAPQKGSFIYNFEGEICQQSFTQPASIYATYNQDQLRPKRNSTTNFSPRVEELEYKTKIHPKAEELAKHLAHLGKIQEKRRRQRAGQLSKVQYKLRSDNQEKNEPDKQNHFAKMVRKLEKYCEELKKMDRQQKAKVHNKFRNAQLAKVHCKPRNENEKDNELEKNFENMIFKKKLVPLLLDRHFALATSFQLYGYKAWKEFRQASTEIIF